MKNNSVKTLLTDLNNSVTKFYPNDCFPNITFCYPSTDIKNEQKQECAFCGSTAVDYIHFNSKLTRCKNYSDELTLSKPGVFACGFNICYYKITNFLKLFCKL